MTDAAREALQRRAGLAAVALWELAAVALWEKEHGFFSDEEMKEARRRVAAQLLIPRPVRRPA